MDWGVFFSSLPIVGWIVFILIIFVAWFALFFFYNLAKDRDIKIKSVEMMQKSHLAQKELHRAEGKSMLSNQTSNAHNLLEQIWIDLYEVGKEKLGMTDRTELFVLEDISKLIEGRLVYEVKNDLMRNGIAEKDDTELSLYSDAKAVGYYHYVKAQLYAYNQQLPNCDLSRILDYISVETYKKIFGEIYFNARNIAGGFRQ